MRLHDITSSSGARGGPAESLDSGTSDSFGSGPFEIPRAETLDTAFRISKEETCDGGDSAASLQPVVRGASVAPAVAVAIAIAVTVALAAGEGAGAGGGGGGGGAAAAAATMVFAMQYNKSA